MKRNQLNSIKVDFFPHFYWPRLNGSRKKCSFSKQRKINMCCRRKKKLIKIASFNSKTASSKHCTHLALFSTHKLYFSTCVFPFDSFYGSIKLHTRIENQKQNTFLLESWLRTYEHTFVIHRNDFFKWCHENDLICKRKFCCMLMCL